VPELVCMTYMVCMGRSDLCLLHPFLLGARLWVTLVQLRPTNSHLQCDVDKRRIRHERSLPLRDASLLGHQGHSPTSSLAYRLSLESMPSTWDAVSIQQAQFHVNCEGKTRLCSRILKPHWPDFNENVNPGGTSRTQFHNDITTVFPSPENRFSEDFSSTFSPGF